MLFLWSPYCRCEFDRLQRTFTFTNDFDSAEGLIYLKYVYNVIRKSIYSNVKDEIPLDNLVYNKFNTLIRNYKENHEIDKTLFSRFTPSKIKKIEQVSYYNCQ